MISSNKKLLVSWGTRDENDPKVSSFCCSTRFRFLLQSTIMPRRDTWNSISIFVSMRIMLWQQGSPFTARQYDVDNERSFCQPTWSHGPTLLSWIHNFLLSFSVTSLKQEKSFFPTSFDIRKRTACDISHKMLLVSISQKKVGDVSH